MSKPKMTKKVSIDHHKLPSVSLSDEFEFDISPPQKSPEIFTPSPIDLPPMEPPVEKIKKERKKRAKKIEDVIPDNQLTVKKLMNGLGNENYSKDEALRMAKIFGYTGNKNKIGPIENTKINLGTGDDPSSLEKIVDFVRGGKEGEYSYKNIENLTGYDFNAVSISSKVEDIHNQKIMNENKNNIITEFGNDLYKNKDEIRSSMNNMNSLKDKMSNGQVLSSDEVSAFEKSSETLNSYTERYKDIVSEHGAVKSESLNNNPIYQELKNTAKTTKFNKYEITGEADKKYFKRKEEKVINEESVSSYIKNMENNGEYANVNDVDIASFFKKNTLEEFGDDTLNNLVSLKKKNIPLDEEAQALLQAGVKLKSSNISKDSPVHSDFNNAIANYKGEYSNVTENDIAFMGNDNEYSIGIEKKNGKFAPTEKTITAIHEAFEPLEIEKNKTLKNLSQGKYDSNADYSSISDHLEFHKNKMELLEEYSKYPTAPFQTPDKLNEFLEKGVKEIKGLKDGGKYGHTPESYLKERFIDEGETKAKELIEKIKNDTKIFSKEELGVITDIGHKGVDFSDYLTANISNKTIDTFLKNNTEINLETLTPKTKRKILQEKIGLGEKDVRAHVRKKAQESIANIPSNEKGAYLDFERREINSTRVLSNAAEEIRTKDMPAEELVSKLYDIKEVKAKFTTREEAFEKYSKNPQNVIKEIESNIEAGLKGNMFDIKTKEALANKLEINGGLGIGITENVQKTLNKDESVSPAYKPYVEGTHKKLEKATSKIKDGDIDPAKLGEYAKEAIDNVHEGPLPKIGGKASKMFEKLKEVHKGGLATMAGIAIAGAAIAGATSVVSSAQDERKRKEEQLANLMSIQNGNARGMY